IGRAGAAIWKRVSPTTPTTLLDRRPSESKCLPIGSSFGQQYLPNEDPIGKHLLSLGRRSYKVVGVVGDTRFHIAAPARPIMYFPLYANIYQGVPVDATLAVRSSRDATSLALPIQQVVQQLDRELAVSDILTMDQMIGKSTLDSSFDATL